ncbi:MAG: PhoH family protein [Clostridia bacterium]|nr:PhoH family protein [Clostridia bacterium]MBQ4327255.1 PhoH family protein [Clostridia bacterium]
MQKKINFSRPGIISKIFGSYDVNIRLIEQRLSVEISSRSGNDGDSVIIDGAEEKIEQAAKTISYLEQVALRSDDVSDTQVNYVLDMIEDGKEDLLVTPGEDCICITSRGKPIKAKTAGQKQYVNAIEKNTIVLGVGPAGTGKTFLAVAMAVKALREKKVAKIILTRPAVEAGERLGFLPGDLQSKIDPYLRPLYDALFEMMGPENYQRQLEKNIIEVAPLAYMRGRTLDDSFIILDEAQNATPEQMKMFLTRLGFNSKAVVTGDLTQTDLPFGKKSGLAIATKILDGIDDIAIHHFTDRDVVRHRLVQKIIQAYDKYERTLEAKKEESKEKTFRRRT